MRIKNGESQRKLIAANGIELKYFIIYSIVKLQDFIKTMKI